MRHTLYACMLLIGMNEINGTGNLIMIVHLARRLQAFESSQRALCIISKSGRQRCKDTKIEREVQRSSSVAIRAREQTTAEIALLTLQILF